MTVSNATLTAKNATATRNKLLVLIGYAEAEEEIYQFRRQNLVVINGQNLTSQAKGDDEIMRKIRKRKDGRWEGRICKDGKRMSCYGKTQKECFEKYKKLKNSFKKIESKNKHVPNNFIEFAKIWLEKYKKPEVKPQTYQIYANTVNKHLIKLKGKIEDLSISDLQTFLNNEGQTRTKEIAFITIKQIFKKAYELDLVKKDISQFLTKGKIERKQRISFSLNEQKVILEHLTNNTISKYILAYLMLGARLSELSSIKKENIKQNYVLIKGTKTKNAERWVKISDKYQKILLNYSEPIFNCQPDTIKAKMREFFQKIGIKGSTHMLRHTFATNLYYLGVDDNTRKQYLGHSSIVVTNDIYTHLDPTITKDDIIKLYGDLYPKF